MSLPLPTCLAVDTIRVEEEQQAGSTPAGSCRRWSRLFGGAAEIVAAHGLD
jgi:hypothetical protein